MAKYRTRTSAKVYGACCTSALRRVYRNARWQLNVNEVECVCVCVCVCVYLLYMHVSKLYIRIPRGGCPEEVVHVH